jgi:hypothetical protein
LEFHFTSTQVHCIYVQHKGNQKEKKKKERKKKRKIGEIKYIKKNMHEKKIEMISYRS